MKRSADLPLPYWKKLILVLTAGWVIIFTYRTLLVPIYPIISEFFGGATNVQLGSITSCYFLGYVCMQIPSGLLVDKIGRKQIVVPSFLVFALGAAIVSLASSLTAVYVGSLIAGIGCGTFYGVAYSFTAEYVPANKKSLATAIVNSGIAAGSSLGLISSSYFAGQHFIAWQHLIMIVIAFIVVMVFVFRKFIMVEEKNGTSTKPLISSSSQVNQQPALNQAKAENNLFKSLCRPQMIAAYILYFSTLYTYYLIDTWLPNFLETEKSVNPAFVGIMSSLAFFSAIPGALLFSYIADIFFKKKIQIIITLEIMASICLFTAVYSVNTGIIIISIIAYGFFGKLVVEPIIIAWLSQFASRKRLATTYGVFNFFGMLSAVIVPSLTGYISDIMHSKTYAFYLAIIITLTGTLSFYLITKFMVNNKSTKIS